MAAWFKPTAANYFSRVGKPGTLAALQEVKGATAPAWANMKKSELAILAEREPADTGQRWGRLPSANLPPGLDRKSTAILQMKYLPFRHSERQKFLLDQ